METGILEQDRNGIVEALLRLAAEHPMADVEAATQRLCRAVSAVRRYDDRVCASEALMGDASGKDDFEPAAGDCRQPNG